MVVERISKICIMLDGEIVYVVGDRENNMGFWWICFGCFGKDVEYCLYVGVLFGVLYYVDLDFGECFVLIKDSLFFLWCRQEREK